MHDKSFRPLEASNLEACNSCSEREQDKSFSGYRWSYFSNLPEGGPLRSRAEHFLASVDWAALLKFAARQRDGIPCVLLPDIGLGYNHMVRIVEFEYHTRWVARLRMPPLPRSGIIEDSLENLMRCEFNAISLVRKTTSIPVPSIHAFEPRSECSVKAPLMLMDCLEGNVGMDLGMAIPPEYKTAFLKRLASIHVQLSAVQLPKIGTIVSVNEDGTYQQGPIPGIGGPFDTATEFFKAWAAKVEFGMSQEKLRAASGQYASEIIASVATFKKAIEGLADKLSVHDDGPFPLCHGDFGHNNIVVDDRYEILGVIDWETAFAGPWEVYGDYPLTLSITPPVIDAPWKFDSNGNPKSPDLIQKFADQKDYLQLVREEESRIEDNKFKLSEILGDSRRQQM